MSEEQSGKKVSRRRVLSAGGLTVAALGGVSSCAAAEPAQTAKADANTAPTSGPAASRALAAGTTDERFVTVTEGTNIAAAVSPDGRTVAFDLYGQLWLVGIEGGTGAPAYRRSARSRTAGLGPRWREPRYFSPIATAIFISGRSAPMAAG